MCSWHAVKLAARRSCGRGTSDGITFAWLSRGAVCIGSRAEAMCGWLLGQRNREGACSDALHARYSYSGMLPWLWLAAQGRCWSSGRPGACVSSRVIYLLHFGTRYRWLF